MKAWTICVCVFFLVQSVSGQSSSRRPWMLSLHAGIEAHDKRNYRQTRPLTCIAETYGTYHAGALLQRKVLELQRLSLWGGLGFNYELATMRRSFDHGHFYDDGPVPYILLYQNRYTKLSTPATVSCWFEFMENFFLSALIEANWLVHRRITHSEGFWDGMPYTENTFTLEDIQCRLGLRYGWRHMVIGLDTRAFNFQKTDQIIFSPSKEEQWEWYNPLRFDFIIGYVW